MKIRVEHSLGDLERDLMRAGPELHRQGAKVVRQNVAKGLKTAQWLAKSKSGPHGKNYWKRLSSEMTGPLSGEYGPHAGGTPVGAGWRHGPPNNDLPQSADIIAPEFHDDVDKMLDSIFWGGRG